MSNLLRWPAASAVRAALGRCWRSRARRRAGLFLLLLVGSCLGLVVIHRPTPAPAALAEAVAKPGWFRPTPGQWAGLTLAPAGSARFQPAEQADGRIAANDDTTTPVFSPYSGRVTRVFASAGAVVRPGDPLFAIEASEFVQAQNDLIAAAAALSTAEAQTKLAETAEQRAHALVEARGGALKDWQQAQLDLAGARGGERTARIALAAVRNRLRILGKSAAEIARLEHGGAAMPAESVVRAPIGGTVLSRQVGVGQYLVSGANGGSSPVFTIGDPATVWLVANVREAEAGAMRVGLPVAVRVPAHPGRVFQARLSYVATAFDPATHRLPVRAEIANPDGALKPEMFARFRIDTAQPVEAVAVPAAAVVREGEAARVWVADPANRTLALRPVETGLDQDGRVEIRSGLAVGETVVVSGALFIDRAASAD